MAGYTPDDQIADFAEQKDKLKTLRLLTLLTFIGCGLAYLLTLAMPLINDFMLNMLNKAASSGKEMSAKELADIDKAKAVLELSKANVIPLVIISLIATTMCLFGAIWMRKLKKDGFWIYTVGEILPVVANFYFLGSEQYTGVTSIVLAFVVPVLFIVLYATQRKHLTQ